MSKGRRQLGFLIRDLLEFFDSLDANDKLPPVYCEPNDLLKLPPLVLDPVSNQIRESCKSLRKIGSSIHELKEHLRASLSKELATVKNQISGRL